MALVSIVQLTDTDYSLRIDPEYFQPHYEVVRKQLPEACQTILGLASVTDGNHNAIAGSYVTSGKRKRYLRGADVNDFFIADDSPIFVTKETYDGLGRGYVKPGDILVSIVGTIGSVSLVAAWREEMCANCKLAILRPHSMPSEVLAAFFLTDVGQALLQMEVRGSVQQGIPLEGLEKMRIPPIPENVWDPVRKLVVEASTIVKLAREGYPAAEGALLDRMGWQDLEKRQHELCYMQSLESLDIAERIDAEHFQPQYTRLRQRLVERGADLLGGFCPETNRGVQPDFVENGDIIVIDSKAVRPEGVEPDRAQSTSSEFAHDPNSAKARIRRHDVLLNSTGRGTLGRAAHYDLDCPAIADNHVTIIRPDPSVCLPAYLSLFLNSPAGLSQSDMSDRLLRTA
jgi:hypothetical protein